jgi:hypothetical protein
VRDTLVCERVDNNLCVYAEIVPCTSTHSSLVGVLSVLRSGKGAHRVRAAHRRADQPAVGGTRLATQALVGAGQQYGAMRHAFATIYREEGLGAFLLPQ